MGIVYRILQDLEKMKLLIIIENMDKGEAERFIPAEDINKISIGMVLERMDNIGVDFSPINMETLPNEWKTIRELRHLHYNKNSVLLKDIK
jgi:membrane protein